MATAPPNGFAPGNAQWNYYWGGDLANPYYQPNVAYWPGAKLGTAPPSAYDPSTWQNFGGVAPSADWNGGQTVAPGGRFGGTPTANYWADQGLPTMPQNGVIPPGALDQYTQPASTLGPGGVTGAGLQSDPSLISPGAGGPSIDPTTGQPYFFQPMGGGRGFNTIDLSPQPDGSFGMPSVPGGGNSSLGPADLSTILGGIPGIGGGDGIPGLANSAFGGGNIGRVLGSIFGGKGAPNLNLNSILQSIIPIAGSFLQYLGSDKAFNQAGNLINTAELGAAGGVRGATGNANDLLNSLQTTTTGNAAPYIRAGAGAAGQLASDLQPGGALNSPLTADQLLKNDPGYQFRLGEGEGDLQSRLAAEGLSGSGEAAKQLSDYQQNFASGEFENAFKRQQEQQQNLFSRLAGTAGLGLQGGGQALTSAEAFGAPQASNLISSSVYGGNAGVTGAGAQAGALIDSNQQKNAMIQNIMTALLSLLRPSSIGGGQPAVATI